MCNEKMNKEQLKDYRFIDYRLDQLELRITKGLEKLETEQAENNKEILRTLQLMQEGQNEQNKTLIELSTRQENMEQKVQCIDRLREIATKNTTEIREVERRLEIYKQLLLVVGTGVAVALITEIVKFI